MSRRRLRGLLWLGASALTAWSAGCSWLAQPEGCERDEHCREGYVCVATRCEAAPGESDAGRRDDGGAPSDDAGAPSDDAGAPFDDAGAPSDDAGLPFDDAGDEDGGEDGGPPLDLDPTDGGPPPLPPDGGVPQILSDGRGDSGPPPDGGPVPDAGALDAGALDDGRIDGGDAADDDGGPAPPGVDSGEDENGRLLG